MLSLHWGTGTLFQYLIISDNMACMDNMDLAVCCLKKAVKLNHSLTLIRDLSVISHEVLEIQVLEIKIIILMALFKTIVSPLLMHWRYCSLALSHGDCLEFWLVALCWCCQDNYLISELLLNFRFVSRSFVHCFVQDCSNSIATALVILQSCSKLSRWFIRYCNGPLVVFTEQSHHYDGCKSPGEHFNPLWPCDTI